MVDVHCHILPGLDDGPKTMEESVEMANAAIADGDWVVIRQQESAEIGEIVALLWRQLRQRGLLRFGDGAIVNESGTPNTVVVAPKIITMLCQNRGDRG